jgi:hypothetical protein
VCVCVCVGVAVSCPAAREKQKRVTTPATDTEPVFYNQVPLVLVQELMHMSSAVAVVDLTVGAGTWALAALEAAVPYFGVVLTQKHQEAVIAHLQKEAPPRRSSALPRRSSRSTCSTRAACGTQIPAAAR